MQFQKHQHQVARRPLSCWPIGHSQQLSRDPRLTAPSSTFTGLLHATVLSPSPQCNTSVSGCRLHKSKSMQYSCFDCGFLLAVISRETALFQHGPSPSSTPNPLPAMRRKNSTSVDQATAWMRKPLPFQTQYCLFSFIAEPFSPTCVCQNDHQYSRDGAGLMETREFDGDDTTE